MTDQDIKMALKGKFQHFEVPAADPYEWDELDRKLEDKRFFRFAYNRFNIYYLCFIAAYGLVTTGLTALYIKEHYIDHVHHSIFVQMPDSSSVAHPSRQRTDVWQGSDNDVEGLHQSAKDQQHVKSLGVEPSKQHLDTTVAYTGQGKPVAVNTIDTVKAIPEKATHTVDDKKSTQALTVINKQDTIRKYDTVYVQKKKRFRLK